MRKPLKWILIAAALLVSAYLLMKAAGSKDSTLKVATEKAARRTIVESVSASGKICRCSSAANMLRA